jgi:glycosyltransferase involved in cell wall biosynthesis
MAVCNGEKCIKNAIESILNQTYQNFEFIIIDDGSKDNTLQILKEYALKDKRFRIFKNPTNIGLTKSLNKAIKLSTSNFIARQDADDISLTQRLEKQLNFLHDNPSYAFCGCNGIIKENNKQLTNIFEFEEIKRNLIIQNCFTHPSILIRKSIFEKYGYYPEKFLYGQDYELWCRLIYKYQLKAINLPDQLIIMNIPIESLLSKKINKFLIQTKNKILTRIKYIKYAKNKCGAIKSIFKDLIDIIYVSIFISFKKMS